MTVDGTFTQDDGSQSRHFNNLGRWSDPKEESHSGNNTTSIIQLNNLTSSKYQLRGVYGVTDVQLFLG